jgi:hypothetical protein
MKEIYYIIWLRNREWGIPSFAYITTIVGDDRYLMGEKWYLNISINIDYLIFYSLVI